MAVSAEDKPKFAIPKTEAEVADRWFLIMHKRLALQRMADALEAEEKFLKAHVIDTLPASKAEGITGKLVSVIIDKKNRYEITDADAFYEHIRKNAKKGAFAFLNRAVNQKTAAESWAAKRPVPGLTEVPYKTLKYSARPGAINAIPKLIETLKTGEKK